MTQEEILRLPKIDLHCHLDGSLSLEFVRGVLGDHITPQMLQADPDCQSLVEYLEKFDLPLQCMQTKEHIESAAYDLIRTCAKENVIYIETRFAPLFSMEKGLSVPEIIKAVLDGLERGKKQFGVESNIIVCAMRHHTKEQNLQLLHDILPFVGHGVCAVDLAGDEANNPMKNFDYYMEEIHRLNIPCTIHAGETGNFQNILDALDRKADRIGHGIAMSGHPDIIKCCSDRQIGIEMCPVSNIQTHCSTIEDYPIHEFLDADIIATINTDNRTVSQTSSSREITFLQEQYGITDEQIRRMMRNAVKVSFADDDVKECLLKKLQ
ncbi:MAG: adenosine deaminase [Eubacteriales bacterium]|nr:adenosine deaminase [Eubacteriales bacterium]